MSNQYFNFYYDPVRQGYDSSTWRTIYGQPVISSTRLLLSQAEILHYGDILRGDAVFNLNIPAPVSGADGKFGFIQYNKNAYAYFKILNDVFTVETSDGTTTNSETITWQSAWTNTNTEFRIKWEAGTVTFFVSGNYQAVIQDISVSGDPMSLYVSNNSSNSMLLNYINVKGIQSYMFSSLNEDSSFGSYVYNSSAITISEGITIFITNLFVNNGTISNSISITESATVVVGPSSLNPSVSDSLTVTDVASETRFSDISVIDELTVTDVPTISEPVFNFDVSDSLTITESVTQDMA